MNTLLAWIVLIPLISAVFVGVAYMYSITKRPISKLWFTLPALSAPFLSFALGVVLFREILDANCIFTYKPYMWLSLDSFDIYMGFLGD